MRNLKRALSLALASVMLLGMMVVGTSAASYPDVDTSDNLEAIEVLKAVGVMTGDENGNFNPDQMVTRNEMAVVMVNLLGLKAGGKSPFTDVPDWAEGYVAACYNNDIIAGVSADKFNGSANVTAVQAGLMVMKALGYFGYQGEFADDWKLAVVKQATKIDLYDGINAYTDQNMTRNDIAQLVLNALQCDVQVVTEQGGLSVDGNGISVNVKPSYDYDDAKDQTGHKYDRVDDGILQLTEKLFGSDLKKNSNSTDAFGRPTTEWTYGDKKISAPKASTVVYTDEVKLSDIYSDLGLSSTLAGANVKFVINGNGDETATANDGTTVLSGQGLSSTTSAKIGNKGTVIEVYYDRDAATDKAIIAMYNYYLAKADEDYDADDEEVDVTVQTAEAGITTSVTLKAEDFAVANVKKDDYLVLTIANDVVKSVAAADAVENAVVSVARAADYVIADGTKYPYSDVAEADTGALGYNLMSGTGYDINGDGYNLYLDPNGYVLGVEGYDAGVKLDDYIFIKDKNTNGFDVIVKALFTDGTTKTVTVSKVNDNDATVAAVNDKEFYKFETDKDGNYKLTEVATSGSNIVTQGNTGNTPAAITSSATPISNSPLAGTTATVFIAKDKVYTGVKNAPEVASSTVYYLLNTDGRLMLVYTETAGSSKTSTDDLVYILNSTPAQSKDGDNTYFIYDAIVNGEKTTLEANQSNKAAGVYKIGTYTDGRADLGTALAAGDDALVNVLGTVFTGDYKDGTLTLGGTNFLLAENAQIFTIDDTTVKTISASGVKKAISDGFSTAYAIEVSSSNDEIAVVYLSK